jgi:hypothetical protein
LRVSGRDARALVRGLWIAFSGANSRRRQGNLLVIYVVTKCCSAIWPLQKDTKRDRDRRETPTGDDDRSPFGGARGDFLPGYEASSWQGLVAAKNTPADTVELQQVDQDRCGRSRIGKLKFINTRVYARASLKSRGRRLVNCDSLRARSADSTMVTLTPGPWPWPPMRLPSNYISEASSCPQRDGWPALGRRCHAKPSVVPIPLYRRITTSARAFRPPDQTHKTCAQR